MEVPGDIPPISVFYLLRNPVIRALCVSGTALCFTATAFDAVFVLFCYTPIQLGGLDFSVRIYSILCSLWCPSDWV